MRTGGASAARAPARTPRRESCTADRSPRIRKSDSWRSPSTVPSRTPQFMDMRRILSVDVKNLLQRIDVRVDEEASVDFEGRIGAEGERLQLQLLGGEQLVVDVVARQKA